MYTNQPMATATTQVFLSQRGYGICKNSISSEVLEEIKKKCVVSPYRNPNCPNQDSTKIVLFKESSKKIYIPRSLGLEMFGTPNPENDTLHNGDTLNASSMAFNGKLRDDQVPIVEAFESAARDPIRQGGIISIPCGGGKCLGFNTPIMMYDGSIKMVQDIQVSDEIMGDDSTKRRILSVCHGVDELFKVTQDYGDPYIVNKAHILSLRLFNHQYPINISIEEYLTLSPVLKSLLMGYKVPIELNVPDIMSTKDAYNYGYNLNMYITSNDTSFLQSICTSTSNIRKSFIAGIIDVNGGCIFTKYTNGYVNSTILRIARTIGLHAEIIDSSIQIFSGLLSINDLPTHQYVLDLHCNNYNYYNGEAKGHLLTRISVESIGYGNYYGFEIDGNNLFVLGDCTVTHNTTISLYIASLLKKRTLVVCHKEFLMNQWRERIATFLPKATVGLIKAKTIDTDDKDIVIASLQSLAMKEYNPDLFKQFGFVIIDEVHHTSAEVFNRALPKITSRVMLGLSATLNRKDGLRKVFEYYLGNVVHKIKRTVDNNMIVEIIEYKSCDFDELYMRNGKINIAGMINQLCSHMGRTQFIVDKIKQVLEKEPERKILLLSDRRAHLQAIYKLLKEQYVAASVGYYIGGMKDDELSKSAQCDIILGTNMMAAEGMDIPSLNTLILASPIGSVEQQLGRIQRQRETERKITPYTIDILDNYSLFKNQGMRRKAFYKKKNYNVVDNVCVELPKRELEFLCE